MDLNALDDFQLVAAHGGFGRASRASGRSKATLSRRVTELEEALGVRLVERGARSLQLTEAGQQLLARTEGPMYEVADAIAAVREGVATPRGNLRIAAPSLFGQLALGTLVARFRTLYPDVEIEVVADDRRVNLVEEQFDIAIRIDPDPDTALVGRCFARDRLVLAAPPLLAPPSGDLDEVVPVPAVVMPSYREGDIWTLRDRAPRLLPRPVLRLSSLLMVRDAIVAGAGVGLVPQSIIGGQLQRGELVSWGTRGGDVALWVLHTSRRLQSPKVRAFVEFLCDQYPDKAFLASV
ncbi:LysR family transcriptional regulator [Amantichitinum ursilacus]|uniref:HTH-type transcriptional regulator DmlR n=1 Tax=Amantichitinum ursilacus TaxID=857265 RepID=A0A0N0XNH9_9NEIS|nr:LysR family transcriptional regulator [Amantichitinum ursilacus]KPC55196.1 HTH-type transcriptional regulator DmlR [Amantichitinum ursilacus]